MGPARVCVIAQTFEVNNPRNMQAAVISTTDVPEEFTSGAGIIAAAQRSRPVAAYDLRTRPGSAPARIQRSEVQPPKSEEMAITQKGIDPNTAMLPMENPRSETR